MEREERKRKRKKNRWGRTSVRRYLHYNPEQFALNLDPLALVLPPVESWFSKGVHLEMYDLRSEKLVGHATAEGGHEFWCPSCKWKYIISYDEWTRLEKAVMAGQSFHARCRHCSRTDPILSLVAGDPPMVYRWWK
jgi:hypothetical protein